MSHMVAGKIGHDVRVRLGNDAELGARAEHTRGAGRYKSNLIYLSCDVGVGGGVIVEGAPMMGASGYAGEIGHQPFNPRGKVCRCGNVGCWEVEIGSHAVADAVGCPESEMHRLSEYLQPGTKATPELRRVGRSLGLGLGGLVNMFNPEMIILGGVLRWVFPLVREDVLSALEDWALEAPAEQAQIVLPWLAGDSVILGAAELAFADLFLDPATVLAKAEGAMAASPRRLRTSGRQGPPAGVDVVEGVDRGAHRRRVQPEGAQGHLGAPARETLGQGAFHGGHQRVGQGTNAPPSTTIRGSRVTASWATPRPSECATSSRPGRAAGSAASRSAYATGSSPGTTSTPVAWARARSPTIASQQPLRPQAHRYRSSPTRRWPTSPARPRDPRSTWPAQMMPAPSPTVPVR